MPKKQLDLEHVLRTTRLAFCTWLAQSYTCPTGCPAESYSKRVEVLINKGVLRQEDGGVADAVGFANSCVAFVQVV